MAGSVYRSLVQLQEQATDKRDALEAVADMEAAAAADEAAAAAVAADHAGEAGPLRKHEVRSGAERAGSGRAGGLLQKVKRFAGDQSQAQDVQPAPDAAPSKAEAVATRRPSGRSGPKVKAGENPGQKENTGGDEEEEELVRCIRLELGACTAAVSLLRCVTCVHFDGRSSRT